MNPSHARSQWLVITSLLALAPWSAHVVAQVPTSPPPQEQEMLPQPGEMPPPAIDDKKLDQFAEAFVVVESIQRDAIERLETETDQQKASQLKAKAESDAIAAVEKTGLPLVEFNQIAELMMTDLTLREKVAVRVAQRRPATENKVPAS